MLKNNNEIYKRLKQVMSNLENLDETWEKLNVIFDKKISEIKEDEFSFIEDNKFRLLENNIRNELNELILDIESINYQLSLKYPSISQRHTEIKNKLYYTPNVLYKCNRNMVTNKFIEKNIGYLKVNGTYPLNPKENFVLSKLDLFERLDYLKDTCKDAMRLIKHINCNYIDVDEDIEK